MIDGFQALFSNAAGGVGRKMPVVMWSLSDLGSQYVSIFLGVRAAPAVGMTPSAPLSSKAATTSPSISDAVAVDASFYGSAVLPLSTYVWGKALATGAIWSSTTNGVSVDGRAATSNGYIAFLHVTQTAAAQASNNWSFKIEHSANDSTWSTLGTFSANGSALVADRLSGSGTVNRYGLSERARQARPASGPRSSGL